MADFSVPMRIQRPRLLSEWFCYSARRSSASKRRTLLARVLPSLRIRGGLLGLHRKMKYSQCDTATTLTSGLRTC